MWVWSSNDCSAWFRSGRGTTIHLGSEHSQNFRTCQWTSTWLTRTERVKWDEMIHVMSCSYVSMSCHVMACRRGWFLAWPPCHIWQWEFAGTFSRRHRWVFLGPCHLCVHGLITINCNLIIDSCGMIILHKTPCCTLQRPNDIQEFSGLSGISFWNLGT